MEDQQNKRKVLQKQAADKVFNVTGYFKREADNGLPVHDVAKCLRTHS
jgi:hypothetical protein